MVQDSIQLGVIKKPQGKSLSCAKLRGFFYGGGVCETQKRSLGNARIGAKLQGFGTIQRYLYVRVDWPMRVSKQVKILSAKHLILQTKWPSGGILVKVGRTESSLCCRYVRSAPQVRSLSRPFIFYDNPSSKRVARCTNILHTGATLSGVGEGQRLRKGFQGLHSSVGGRERLRLELETVSSRYKATILQALSVTLFASSFESLSSAAKIRHSARNMRLWDIDLCLACTHR